jgi:hypothetical protein
MAATKTPGGSVDPSELGILPDPDAENPVLFDYTEFMSRARWKSYKEPSQSTRVCNYLEVL